MLGPQSTHGIGATWSHQMLFSPHKYFEMNFDEDDETKACVLIACLCSAGGTVRTLERCRTPRTGWRRIAGGTDGSRACCRPTCTHGWRARSTNRRRCPCPPPRRVLSRNDNRRSSQLPQPTKMREMMRIGTSSASLPASTTAAAARFHKTAPFNGI